MSQILYINILVDWSLSGIMTAKLVIRKSESPRPATSSILISRMTNSSVIIPYKMWDRDDADICPITVTTITHLFKKVLKFPSVLHI